VRNAVAWVGLPDPGETRLALQQTSDVTAENMAVLLTALQKMDPERRDSWEGDGVPF
jgi:hypothetical protein